MPDMVALGGDDPRMVAWEAYKATPEYANTRKWARTEHAEGSLWAAFLEGWARAVSADRGAAAPPRARRRRRRRWDGRRSH